MTKQITFVFLAIVIMLMGGSAYYLSHPTYDGPNISVTTFNVASPKCDKYHRCAGIDWDVLQGNIDVMARSMKKTNNLDIKQLDYGALHKAGLLPPQQE